MKSCFVFFLFSFNVLFAFAHTDKERDQAALEWAQDQGDMPLRQLPWDELNGSWRIIKESGPINFRTSSCIKNGGVMRLHWFSGGETPHSKYFGTQVLHSRYCRYTHRGSEMNVPYQGGTHWTYKYDRNGPAVLSPVSLLTLSSTWKIVGYRPDQGWLVMRGSFGREIVLRRD
jgi:hypothetical protein